MSYPSWAPPELEGSLSDDELPPRMIEIIRQLTVDVPEGQVVYAKAFWREIEDTKGAAGAIFTALGGNPMSNAQIKAHNANIARHAKALSRLLRNTSADIVKLNSVDLDADCSYEITPHFHLSDVLDSINPISGGVVSQSNTSRDVFIRKLGDSFKGEYMFNTITNAYNLTHEDQVTFDIVKNQLRG